eukprot:766862-Hanusia_phi.AAC.7
MQNVATKLGPTKIVPRGVISESFIIGRFEMLRKTVEQEGGSIKRMTGRWEKTRITPESRSVGKEARRRKGASEMGIIKPNGNGFDPRREVYIN